MNFLEAFNNKKTIRIPLLQRDYVQGANEVVISPFLDSLFSKDKACDLNYIYGYTEDGCFVPIDGQQRLTTLWLLYLYLYARKNIIDEFGVSLRFISREYAEDFCNSLQKHLSEVLHSVTIEQYKTLEDALSDCGWFLTSWKMNATVQNMLKTLTYIHRKIGKIDESEFDAVWNLIIKRSDHIVFAFLDMDESNGLDDDIYIKMNGRGRKLSAFENLKSWMDEKVSILDFGENWKRQMDNQWTNLFWKNRNKEQEHPEEIDDEQLWCFCNLLTLYHVSHDDLPNRIQFIKENEPVIYEELLLVLRYTREIPTQEEVCSKIIHKWFVKGEFPALTWVERLDLMPSAFLIFAHDALTLLSGIFEEVNNLSLYFGGDVNASTTNVYRLAMCEGSYERTLPLLYALVNYVDSENISLYDWMRVLRNLILNTDIRREQLPKVMKSIKRFREKITKQDLFEVLSSTEVETILAGFSKAQVKEECVKSQHKELYKPITEMENGRFFRGHIGFMFDFFSDEEGYDALTIDNFTGYANIFLRLFTGEAGGVNSSFDDQEHLIRRALMSFPPYCFGVWRSSWCFCKDSDEWRGYLDEKEKNGAIRLLIKNVLLNTPLSENGIAQALKNRVEEISSHYEEQIKQTEEATVHYHFIHHPGVWDYMSTLRCYWGSDYDVMLKKSNSNNSKRMELRTYGLFLDYKYQEAYKADRNGWNIGIWDRGDSCFYFQREIGDKRIAIDVSFKRNKGENSYVFNIFLRSEEEDINKYIEMNKDFFADRFADLFARYDICINKENGRYCTSKTYSREEVINVLRDVLHEIWLRCEVSFSQD